LLPPSFLAEEQRDEVFILRSVRLEDTMNRSIRVLAFAAASALLAGAARAQSTPERTPRKNLAGNSSTETRNSPTTGAASTSTGTAKFAKDAAVGGLAEVEMGRVATQKASNPRVKEFGQKMVDDHTKANSELKQAASQDGIDVPSELDAKEKKTLDRLSGLSGAAFDKAYMSDMVKDHKKDVAEFDKEAKSGKDSAVKKFAESALPTLREHLKMAEDIHRELGGGMMGSHHKKSAAKTSGSSSY
jgi:putative membrane protein